MLRKSRVWESLKYSLYHSFYHNIPTYLGFITGTFAANPSQLLWRGRGLSSKRTSEYAAHMFPSNDCWLLVYFGLFVWCFLKDWCFYDNHKCFIFFSDMLLTDGSSSLKMKCWWPGEKLAKFTSMKNFQRRSRKRIDSYLRNHRP